MRAPDVRLRLAVLTLTTAPGRAATAVTGWVAAAVARREDLAADVVDIAASGLPALSEPQSGAAVDAFRRRIADADAYVVVTAEHNHGYPAALKQAIDLPYREWAAKPVGFVSHGGVAGGVRAVEQLRQVFVELRTVTVRDAVSFPRVHERIDAAGWLQAEPGCEATLERMLDDLAWWGSLLRRARAEDEQRRRDPVWT